MKDGQPQAVPRRRGRPRKADGPAATAATATTGTTASPGGTPRGASGRAAGAPARSAPSRAPVIPDAAAQAGPAPAAQAGPDAAAQAGPDPLAGTGWPEHVPELAARKHLEVLATVETLRARGGTVYPARADVFRALRATPWDAVRVVILGQDPYHGPGQAHGLAFSVADGVPLPRSLRNIFKEVAADCGAESGQIEQPRAMGQPGLSGPSAHPVGGAPERAPLRAPFAPPSAVPSGNLSRWAAQGVLLLNTVLTVEEGQPNSHAGLGWEVVTRGIVAALGARPQPCVFLLWGRPAHGFAELVTHPAHLVLTAAHPSPLSASRGFFGCRHFSRVNAWLSARGEVPIRW